jgi:hypothetical protein
VALLLEYTQNAPGQGDSRPGAFFFVRIIEWGCLTGFRQDKLTQTIEQRQNGSADIVKAMNAFSLLQDEASKESW